MTREIPAEQKFAIATAANPYAAMMELGYEPSIDVVIALEGWPERQSAPELMRLREAVGLAEAWADAQKAATPADTTTRR